MPSKDADQSGYNMHVYLILGTCHIIGLCSVLAQISLSAWCTKSINSVHTVNNCTCMSVHFYNIMPTFVN